MIRMTHTEGFTVSTNTIVTKPSDTLASAPGLEPHLRNMSMLDGHGVQLEK